MSLEFHFVALLVAAALFFLHEMDAVRCREWRIFPILEKVEERTAMLWFFWLHVPLFGLLIWGVASAYAGSNLFSLLFGGFCVLHGFLHWLYERHPRNEFRNALSRSIIWSCAAAGLLTALTA